MKKIAIEEAAKASGGELCRRGRENYITGVRHDSRDCGKGDLFVAIKGENQDGHDYIPQALEKGCAGVMISREGNWLNEAEHSGAAVIKVEDTVRALGSLAGHYLRGLNAKKVAVTGSVGKTTVRDMIYYVLSEKYRCGRNIKNYNNEIGLPLSILRFEEDTEIVVLELGMSDFGEIDALAKMVEPDVGVITNIGMAHIEHLGSREGIFRAKMEMAPYIGGGTGKGTLVFACDNQMLTRETTKGNYRQVCVGENGKSDYIISDIRDRGVEGISFTLEHMEKTCRISLPVAGRHNAVNAAVAAAVGGVFGIDMKTAAEGLLKTKLTGSRLNIIDGPGFKIIDDTYNASPDSMKGALKVLEKSKGKRKIAILGDMYELGGDSERQHFGIGVFARGLDIDILVAIGKDAGKIAEGAEGGRADIYRYVKKEEFYDKINEMTGDGDIILVKGSRGMEMEQIVDKLLEK